MVERLEGWRDGRCMMEGLNIVFIPIPISGAKNHVYLSNQHMLVLIIYLK